MAMRFRLNMVTRPARRTYITPEATSVQPANRCGRSSRAARLARTTVVTVEE